MFCAFYFRRERENIDVVEELKEPFILLSFLLPLIGFGICVFLLQGRLSHVIVIIVTSVQFSWVDTLLQIVTKDSDVDVEGLYAGLVLAFMLVKDVGEPLSHHCNHIFDRAVAKEASGDGEVIVNHQSDIRLWLGASTITICCVYSFGNLFWRFYLGLHCC